MERLVRMSVDELEQLVAGAEGVYELEEAAYPPALRPPRGKLRLQRLPRGELKVEVEKRKILLGDFQLEVLFGSGVLVFGEMYYFAKFLRGAVANAFGIEIEQHPVRPRPVQTMVEDLKPKFERKKRAAAAKPSAAKPAAVAKPHPGDLARALMKHVAGQDAALTRIADVLTGQLAKVSPARPESLLLLGPHGSGKTRAVEALPDALAEIGHPGAHVFRVDCGQAGGFDATRLLGSAPGYIGYTESPPLLEAIAKPGCILLLDEPEKAQPMAHDVFVGLLDEGRLAAPDGHPVRAPALIVALTSADGADDLEYALAEIPPGSRAELDACRVHLYRQGWPEELIGRIGTFVVFDPPPETSLRDAAEQAIRALGREYGLDVEKLPPVLAEVVADLADTEETGLRAVTHAARDVLMRAFADAAREGITGPVTIDPGPPPQVVAHQGALF